MAITRTETQVTWSAGNSTSVGAGNTTTSDAFTLDPTCVAAAITCKADNSTTAASDDVIYFWWVGSAGDPDGASTQEYDTTGHATLLCALDTSLEDPAIRTVPLPPVPQDGKIVVDGATAGTTNSITCSATIEEQRSA